MAQELANIAIKLSANMVGFENDMGRASRLAKKRSSQMKKDFQLAFKAIISASVAAGGALASLVKVTANTADEIQKMSQRLGVSTEFLSQYRHVAELSGTSMEKVGDGVRKMSKSINDANNGLSTAVRAFDSLGISVDTLNSLNPEQQFELIADRISQVESQSVKAGAAMDIFGRSGSELLTVLNLGSEGIAEMRKEADRFGLTITQQSADGAAIFNDELTRLGNNITGLSESIGQSLIPVATEMIKQINSTEITDGTNKWEGLQTTLITLYGSVLLVGDSFEVLGTVIGQAGVVAVQSFKTIGSGLDVLRKRVVGGIAEIGGLFNDDSLNFAKGVQKDIEEAENQFVGLVQTLEQIGKDSSIGDDVSSIFDETFKKLDKLRAAAGKAGKSLDKDLKKPVNATGDSLDDFNDELELTDKQLKKLADEALREAANAFDDFDSLIQQLETPLESLNRAFKDQIETIGRYILTHSDSADAEQKAAELTKKVTAEYLANKEALEKTLTPYQSYIKAINDELSLIGLTGRALMERQAQLTLEANQITAATVGQEKYNEALRKELELREKIASADGIFGNGTNSFEQLLSDAFTGGNFFKDLAEGFRNAAENGAEAFSQAIGSTADFAAQALGVWESTAGQDDAGRILDTVSQIASTGALGPIAQAIAQVAGFVDQLTGGKLFGTSYEVTGATRNISISQSGGSGDLETTESRQRSLFRGTQRRTTTEDLSAETLAALDDLFDNLQVAIENSALSVGGVAGDIITGSFVEEFDKDGNLTSQIATVLGRTYEESFEEFAQRLTAENILAGIGTVFTEAGQIADRWRHDAQMLLEGSEFLLLAASDIEAGSGLFNELAGVTVVIQDMQKAGETLAETYKRVQGSTLLLDDALDIIGQSFDGARVDYVRLAADITDAAGGLQEAQSLWESYFATFYSEQELFERNLSNAVSNRDDLLGGLGLDSDTSIEQFRELFESALPTLSADAVVQWLEAASAIGVVIDLESDLAEQRAENAEQLADMVSQIDSELEDMGLSPFALRLKEIRKAFNEQIKTAKELGAGERELAMIQAYATRQIKEAIKALESDISSGITDLYGTELDRINEQISLLESQESQIGNVQQASNNLYASQLSAIQNIAGFLDSILLNEQLSPLNPQEQLAEAQSQFDALIAAAQGGDVDALNALPAMAQTLLGFGQDVFASSQDYVDIFNNVTDSLAALGVTATEPSTNPQTQIIGQNSQMIALMQRRNELEEQFNSDSRLQAALSIAEQIRELGSVTGESFAELAERLGIPVELFLSDLGVSLDILTVETATALGETAQLLGVEITDLAASVGISLGELADQNSLINDALESTIESLPVGIQGTLQPLLRAIESATDPSVREALLSDMTDFIEDLPADQRDLLAPYFEQIDPATEAQQQINQMESISDSNEKIADRVNDLFEEQRSSNDSLQFETRAVGSKIDRLSDVITTFIDIAGVA